MGLGGTQQVPQPPPLVRVTGPPPTMGYVRQTQAYRPVPPAIPLTPNLTTIRIIRAR